MLAASHHSTYELQSHFGWKDARTASRYVHAAKTGVPAIAETLSTGGGGGVRRPTPTVGYEYRPDIDWPDPTIPKPWPLRPPAEQIGQNGRTSHRMGRIRRGRSDVG